MRRWATVLPLLLLLLGGVAWSVGLGHALSWQALAANLAQLRQVASSHPRLAPLAFASFYVVTAALSLPYGALLSIAGGVLFGPLEAVLCIVPGATVGATLLFLAARSAFGALLRERAASLLATVRPGLERDGFSYLLSLRLLPVVPFWLANLAPALVGMRLAPFVGATAIGIVPGALLFATVGAGLGDVLAAGGAPDFWSILTPRVLAERGGLALLALAPVVWRRWRRAHG